MAPGLCARPWRGITTNLTTADGSARIDGCNGRPMIIRRGGSYGANATAVRSANRAHAGKINPGSLGEGFRLVESIVLD